MRSKIDIHFDWLIYNMLCLYAFFIPLEKILEVFFGIDTVLKPYRVLAILIIGTFIIKSLYQLPRNKEFKTDLFIYIIFIYGAFITLYRMITTNFHLGYFFNDTFQIVLYLSVFVVIRHTNLSRLAIKHIFQCLLFGIMANAMYIFYHFFIRKSFMRNGGLMDNANYLAFSLALVFIFMIIYRPVIHGLYKKLAWWIGMFFLAYIFIIAGSRGAFAVLVICGTVALYFSPIKDKLMVGLGVLIILGVVVTIGSNYWSTTGPLILLKRLKKDSGEDPRLPAWKGAIRASEATYFAGLGIGQFKARFHEFFHEENHPRVRQMMARGYFLSPHSDYFAILVVYGAIGLIAYLIFLFLNTKIILSKIYESTDESEKAYYQFGLVALLAIVLFGITAESFNSALYWIVLSTSTRVEFDN